MITGPNEECDDGNAVDSDLCTNQCRDARCGDRIVSEIAGETCDDGNVIGDDGRSDICELEGDCGNGQIDDGETCDDANFNNADGCDALCSVERVDIIHGRTQIDGVVASGSKDTFTFSVDADGTRVDVSTENGNGGCPAGVDTNMTLSGPGGFLANNDNRVGDDCSALSQVLNAGDYELTVNDVDDDDAIPAYVLNYRLTYELGDGAKWQGGYRLVAMTDIDTRAMVSRPLRSKSMVPAVAPGTLLWRPMRSKRTAVCLTTPLQLMTTAVLTSVLGSYFNHLQAKSNLSFVLPMLPMRLSTKSVSTRTHKSGSISG